jgi:hypothetical protein
MQYSLNLWLLPLAVLRPALTWSSLTLYGLLALHKLYGQQLTLRVSMGHFEQQLYQQRRGPNAWQPVLDGLCWLSGQGFTIAVAGRRLRGEEEQILRQGYAELFKRHNIQLDAFDQRALLLLPEITSDCA